MSFPDTHDIEFHEDNDVSLGHETSAAFQPLAHGETAQKRRPYNPRKTRAEWEQVKTDLKKLYVDEDNSLEDTMKELQARHRFTATYKGSINFNRLVYIGS